MGLTPRELYHHFLDLVAGRNEAHLNGAIDRIKWDLVLCPR